MVSGVRGARLCKLARAHHQVFGESCYGMSLLMTPVSKFDEAVPFVSGCSSGFWGMGWETDLPAATLFVLVPAFFAAFVGWPSFLEVDGLVAAALLAATMVYAALSVVFHVLAAMLMPRFQEVT